MSGMARAMFYLENLHLKLQIQLSKDKFKQMAFAVIDCLAEVHRYIKYMLLRNIYINKHKFVQHVILINIYTLGSSAEPIQMRKTDIFSLVSSYCQLMSEYQQVLICTPRISQNGTDTCLLNGETVNLDR